jgi:hypothetical protein
MEIINVYFFLKQHNFPLNFWTFPVLTTAIHIIIRQLIWFSIPFVQFPFRYSNIPVDSAYWVIYQSWYDIIDNVFPI